MSRPVIPLVREKYGIQHPYGPAMEITTMVGCPLMCTFCPQKNLHKAYGKDTKYMTVNTLTTVLDKLPINTRIDFSGMAEPWSNPDCTLMLEETLKRGFKVAIFTTLYGMKCEEVNKVVKLLEQYNTQVEIVCIHLPDANGNMLGWRYTDEWKQCFEIISKTKVSCGVGAMTMDGSGKVHSDIVSFAKISYQAELHTRADSLDIEQIGGQTIKQTPRHSKALTCRSTPFYDRNVLLPNGDIVLCCMDYNLKHIIGNLLKQDYNDIFKNNELLELIKINETSEFSKCSICKSCDNVRYI
jgi:radical SAM protein with 4Fe4S-binding SPASM domain